MVKVSKDPAKISDFQEEKEFETQSILKKMRKKSEEEQASQLAKSHGFPYIDLNLVPIDANNVQMIPEKDARKYNIAIIDYGRKKLRAALADPENKEAISYLENLAKDKGWEIFQYVVSGSSLQKVWNKYKDAPLLENLDMLQMSLSGEDLKQFEKKFKDLIDLKEKIKNIPTTEVINIIMAGALKMNASDIHLEPEKGSTRLRYRIDGVLHSIGEIPNESYKSLTSRVKMMSEMKINIRDAAQDGHFNIDLEEGSQTNVRVNIIPGNYGESLVMRILNQSDLLVSVDDLGIQGLAYEKIREEMSRPHGMILTTGPTGSGKTTTLYAIVNELNKPGVKIVTIEDPIEYEIKGISQTQVSKDKEYSFSNGLRAIVRQDPDIILVGEIRDNETAETAINAALTGHLVLSTLHTNNATASISRLIELGARPNLIISAANMFIGQRLVRKLCPHCKKKYVPAQETIESIQKILESISPKAKIEAPKIEYLYEPVGCPKCQNIGYQGRIGIFEILTLSERIKKMVLDMATEEELSQAALDEGMVTLTQDGIIKALEGITSMEEIWRVTGRSDLAEKLY